MEFGAPPPAKKKTFTRLRDKFEAKGTVENFKQRMEKDKSQRVCRFNGTLHDPKEISRAMFRETGIKKKTEFIELFKVISGNHTSQKFIK